MPENLYSSTSQVPAPNDQNVTSSHKLLLTSISFYEFSAKIQQNFESCKFIGIFFALVLEIYPKCPSARLRHKSGRRASYALFRCVSRSKSDLSLQNIKHFPSKV